MFIYICVCVRMCVCDLLIVGLIVRCSYEAVSLGISIYLDLFSCDGSDSPDKNFFLFGWDKPDCQHPQSRET